jgi:hypothetical protein
MIDTIEGAIRVLRSDRSSPVTLNLSPILFSTAHTVEQLTSTKHPLGFLHVNLTPAVQNRVDGETLRLHVWGTGDAQPDELGALHEYTWALKSLVIVGELRDKNYVAKSDSDGPYQGVRVHYGARNSFTLDGNWSLNLLRDRVVRGGEIYSVEPRVIHETMLVRAPTVTLVRALDDPSSAEKGPLVLVPRGQQLAGTSSREAVQSSAVAQTLRNLASAISG